MITFCRVFFSFVFSNEDIIGQLFLWQDLVKVLLQKMYGGRKLHPSLSPPFFIVAL